MGYLDTELTEAQRIELDQLGPSELAELCQNGTGIPTAVLDHQRETQLWWGSTIYHPVYGEEPWNAPDVIPSKDQLARASSRGTFLGEGW